VSKHRKIVVGTQTYTWKFGRSGTLDVRCDGMSFLREPVTEVLGITWDDFERGQWRRYLSVTPADVKRRIINKLGADA
jgi:hypothetical protein